MPEVLVSFVRLEDPVLRAAIGDVSIAHTQLDRVLRMVIRDLVGVTITEAMAATSRESSSSLRRRVKRLARRQLGDGAAYIKLQALLKRCERLTDERNRLIHDVCAKMPGGDHQMIGEGEKFGPLPTIGQLAALEEGIRVALGELNGARLQGFLKAALAEKRKR